MDEKVYAAPTFASRSAAAGAIEAQFPEHGPHIRVGGASLDALSAELLAKREAYRRLGLEVAQLEVELKRKIGLFRGLRTKIGTWFWEKSRPKKKVDWKSLAQSLKVPTELQEKFSYSLPPRRLLRFERAKGPLWKP